MCPLETDRGRLADAVRQRCRSESVEPPTEGQLERVVASAVRRFEEAFADGVVELLIGLIQRINARTERRVEKELIGELAHVPGKRGILGRMVNAALDRPEGTSGRWCIRRFQAGRRRCGRWPRS